MWRPNDFLSSDSMTPTRGWAVQEPNWSWSSKEEPRSRKSTEAGIDLDSNGFFPLAERGSPLG